MMLWCVCSCFLQHTHRHRFKSEGNDIRHADICFHNYWSHYCCCRWCCLIPTPTAFCCCCCCCTAAARSALPSISLTIAAATASSTTTSSGNERREFCFLVSTELMITISMLNFMATRMWVPPAVTCSRRLCLEQCLYLISRMLLSS